jgi:carbon storage regulator
MLVLMRRRGEAVQIGKSIRIVVVDVQGSKVKIGIEAPREIPVDREEIYERKQRDEIDGADGKAGKT